MTKLRGIVGAFAGIVVLAGAAEAQLCTGQSLRSEVGAFGNMGITEGMKTYGASIGAELRNGVGVGVSYDRTMPDAEDAEGWNTFGGQASYSLDLIPGLAICPALNVSHMSIGEEGASASRSDFYGFVGLGWSYQATPTLRLVPFATPGVVHARATADILGEEITASETQFAANLGLGALISRVTVHGSVMITTFEGAEPVFNVGLGYRMPLGR